MTLKQNLNKSKMGERNRIRSSCRRPEEDRQGPAHNTAAVSWLLLLSEEDGRTHVRGAGGKAEILKTLTCPAVSTS